jgi:cell division protein FtsI/penicillin-binding protein 2
MKFAVLVLAAASLYEQSLVKLLEARFPDLQISYLFVKTSSSEILGARWPDAARPVAPGSLVKVFTALAYSDSHAGRFPEFVCRGKASNCWLPSGHGRIGIVEAIAHSCNAYFRTLAGKLGIDDVRAVAQRYGIEPPPESSTAEAFVGLGETWKVTPAALARAYGRLPADSGAAAVVKGMARSARVGTGSAAGFGLVKTGTAPCVHRPHAPGDGFAIALYPEHEPQYALLIRVHGTTGSHAAEVAGRMLRLLKDGR